MMHLCGSISNIKNLKKGLKQDKATWFFFLIVLPSDLKKGYSSWFQQPKRTNFLFLSFKILHSKWLTIAVFYDCNFFFFLHCHDDSQGSRFFKKKKLTTVLALFWPFLTWFNDSPSFDKQPTCEAGQARRCARSSVPLLEAWGQHPWTNFLCAVSVWGLAGPLEALGCTRRGLWKHWAKAKTIMSAEHAILLMWVGYGRMVVIVQGVPVKASGEAFVSSFGQAFNSYSSGRDYQFV